MALCIVAAFFFMALARYFAPNRSGEFPRYLKFLVFAGLIISAIFFAYIPVARDPFVLLFNSQKIEARIYKIETAYKSSGKLDCYKVYYSFNNHDNYFRCSRDSYYRSGDYVTVRYEASNPEVNSADSIIYLFLQFLFPTALLFTGIYIIWKQFINIPSE